MTTISSAPERTQEQRRAALRKANGVRSARKLLKREIKACRRSVLDVLAQPPAEAESMRVFDLLLAAPKVGRVKASKVLHRAGVSPSKTVSGITERQRRELLAQPQLRGRS
jgi:hypothetical protein